MASFLAARVFRLPGSTVKGKLFHARSAFRLKLTNRLRAGRRGGHVSTRDRPRHWLACGAEEVVAMKQLEQSADQGTNKKANSRITITRNSPEDVQTRQIVVFLDGELMGELLFGDEIALPVSPGRHTLRVDNTWNHKDLNIDVSAGDDLHFVTKSIAGDLSRFLLVAFGAGPIYVSIEPVAPPSFSDRR